MNYIELINNYWSLREQGIITGAEGDLYLYLLHTSNKLAWKNPFNQSNRLICAYLNMSEKSLIKYKNTLKQAGLIDFTSGKAIKQNSSYTLLNPCKNYRSSESSLNSSLRNSPVSNLNSSPGVNRSDNIKQKIKSNKTLSLSSETTERENKKERIFFLEFLFFERKILNPVDEVARFINHYEKTNWLDANGNRITNRLAALKSWKVAEGLPMIPKNFADKWRELYDAAKAETDKSILMLTDLEGYQIIDNKLKLSVTKELHRFIEDPDTLMAIKSAYMRMFPGLMLEYILTQ